MHPVLGSTKDYILDLMFTNSENIMYEEPAENLRKTDLHHFLSTFEFREVCGVNNVIVPSVKYRDFKGADYNMLTRKIDLTDWESVLPINDSNLCANSFYKELNKIIDENVPLKTVYSDSFPHWFFKELKKCIVDN